MASHKVLENALADLVDEVNSIGAYDFVPKASQVVVAIEDTPDAKDALKECSRYVEKATATGTPYAVAWENMQQHLQGVTPNPPKLADHTGRTLDNPLDELRAMPAQQTEAHRVEDALQAIERLCSDYKLSPAQEDAVNECKRQTAEVQTRAKNLRVDDCRWVQQMCREGVGSEAFAFLELESDAKWFARRLVDVVELILGGITSRGGAVNATVQNVVDDLQANEPKKKRRTRATKKQTEVSTLAAIQYKMNNPTATAAEVAGEVGIPESTLASRDEWIDWLPKIERAANDPGRMSKLRTTLDRRTGELVTYEDS